MPRLVSIHAESTGVTGVLEVRPVLEGSGRDADPCQRQLLGPSVLAKMIATQRTGGGQQYASGPLFIELFSRWFSLAVPTLVIAPAASQLTHQLQRATTKPDCAGV